MRVTQYRGVLDENKIIENTRILSINPNGFNVDNNEKNNQMLHYYNQNSINIILMSETNGKWNSKMKKIMKYKMKGLGQELEIVFANSREHDKATKNYLPEGLLNFIRGGIVNLIDQSKTNIDKKGNWTAIHFINKIKTISMITLYRIQQTLNKGIILSIAQYN